MSDTAPDPTAVDPDATPSEPAATPAEADPTSSRTRSTSSGRRPSTPVVRWIRSLSQAAFAAILLATIVVLLLVAVVVNRGERVGPVRPAAPPVGGPGLPATRL